MPEESSIRLDCPLAATTDKMAAITQKLVLRIRLPLLEVNRFQTLTSSALRILGTLVGHKPQEASLR